MNNNKLKKKTTIGASPNLSLSFILLLYALVPVMVPDFSALDSNGPKFLVLAVLNLLSYFYLSSRKEIKSQTGIQSEFFKSLPGLTWLLFLILSLLSFVKAINIYESILQFSKTFTVFSSAFILYLIFRKDKHYFTQLIIILTIILIVDCLTVFYNIAQYIEGRVQGIIDIKSVYSNKNILASAIFVKIPFALWLILFGNGRWKTFGLTALFFAFTATLLMSTRAFYLGLIILTIAFVSFAILKYFQSREKNYLSILIKYSSVLVISFLCYTIIQEFLYPQKQDSYNVTIAQRLSTISPGEYSTSLRLMAWKNSLALIKENPLLGVGSGNWKVVDIKFENPVFAKYEYMYKNHNDFIEITAETGILGGMVFLGLFLFIFLDFIKTLFKKAATSNQDYLFIPAFGLVCYSVDAFFNFPADRPEIQLLFAVFISSGICFYNSGTLKFHSSKKIGIPFSLLFISLMLSTIYILTSNVISLRYQRIAWEEIHGGKLATSSAFMKTCYPAIPAIGSSGEAISTIIAWYLLEERKYEEVISLLKNDKSSPFDTRRENLIGRAYARSGMLDSALVYFKYVNEKKPLLYSMVSEICNISSFNGDFQTAIKYITSYLAKVKDDPVAWREASAIYEKSNDFTTALAIIDSSLIYLPNDSLLIKRKLSLKNRLEMPGNMLHLQKQSNQP